LWLLRSIGTARPAMRQWLLLAGIVLLATDLRIHSLGTEFNTYPREWVTRYMESLKDDHPFMKLLNEGLNSGDGPYRAEIIAAESFWANATMIPGIQSTQGYNPLRYVLYERAAGANIFNSAQRPFTPLMPSYNSPLFNLLGVKYIASLRELRDLDPKANESRFKLVYDHGFKVWQNLDVLPRVLTATSLKIDADPDQAVQQTGMPALDYRSTVVLTHLPATLSGLQVNAAATTPLAGDGNATASIKTFRNSEVVIGSQSSRDVIVVLNDLYYPYWRVYVDGHEEELLRSNYIFRGVHVRPGQHEIVFRFEPFSWQAIRATFSGIRAQ